MMKPKKKTVAGVALGAKLGEAAKKALKADAYSAPKREWKAEPTKENIPQAELDKMNKAKFNVPDRPSDLIGIQNTPTRMPLSKQKAAKKTVPWKAEPTKENIPQAELDKMNKAKEAKSKSVKTKYKAK